MVYLRDAISIGGQAWQSGVMSDFGLEISNFKRERGNHESTPRDTNGGGRRVQRMAAIAGCVFTKRSHFERLSAGRLDAHNQLIMSYMHLNTGVLDDGRGGVPFCKTKPNGGRNRNQEWTPIDTNGRDAEGGDFTERSHWEATPPWRLCGCSVAAVKTNSIALQRRDRREGRRMECILQNEAIGDGEAANGRAIRRTRITKRSYWVGPQLDTAPRSALTHFHWIVTQIALPDLRCACKKPH